MHMLQKKFITLLALFIVVPLLTSCVFSGEEATEINRNLETNSYADKNEYVDEQIKMLLTSENYTSSSLSNQESLISQELSRLKKEKAIKHFSYNQNSLIFSYEYLDGSIGGISLQEFGTEFNGIP